MFRKTCIAYDANNAKHLRCIVLLGCLISLSIKSFAQENAQVLNMCVDPDWMPFEAVIDNQHNGIASDYAVLFSNLTSYSLDRVPTQSWHETLEYLQAGKCDLTLMLNSSAEREQYLSFTIPYFFGPNVLVSKSDIPFMQDVNAVGDMTLGVVSGYRLLEEIPKYYPKANIKVVESEEEGLSSVNNGDIDVFVGSLYSVNLSIEKLQLKSLRINGWISIQDKLRIGFTKNNEHLVPLFNQAIDNITTEQHNEILNKWSNVHIVSKTNYTLLYLILGVSILVFTVFLWRHMLSLNVLRALSSKNEELDLARSELISLNKDLKQISFHDHLTTLYNRHYFQSTLENHIAQMHRQTDESSLLMIDLDFFKSINDEYGHAVGDKILKEFAEVMLTSLRAGDVAARWGGEEFIVLLPKSTKDNSMILAQRLIDLVAQHRFEHDISVTISVGIGQLQKSDSIDSWIERADRGLYQAKRDGRNRIQVFD